MSEQPSVNNYLGNNDNNGNEYNQDKLTSKQHKFNLFKNLSQHVLFEHQ